MSTTYDVGDLVRCTGTFTNAAGTAVDPTAVSFMLRAPSGTETTYTYGVDAELVRDGTGVYHVDVDADEEGAWYYRFESTGTGQAAEESRFYVDQSMFD